MMEPRYDPHGVEERWQETWESRGSLQRRPRPVADAVRRRASAAQRHRRAAHRPRAAARGRRHDHPDEADAGLQHALPARLRPRRHLDAERRREAARRSRARPGRSSAASAFEERVWEWLHEYGGKILVQFRRMGASLDYRRTRFTMDDAYIRAVMRFFVHLYGRGWIYRANRIINWCPYHLTSLSDLELDARRHRRHAVDDPLPARRRRRLHRRSRRCARRRSPPTSRSRCIRTTTATGIWSAAR